MAAGQDTDGENLLIITLECPFSGTCLGKRNEGHLKTHVDEI